MAPATSTGRMRQTAETRAPCPIDLVHLARQTLGNKEIETEILRMFARQAPQQVQHVAIAEDAREQMQAAHHLCGSARAIGAWAVAEAAETLEQAATARSPQVAMSLARLEVAVGDAISFIAAMLD